MVPLAQLSFLLQFSIVFFFPAVFVGQGQFFLEIAQQPPAPFLLEKTNSPPLILLPNRDTCHTTLRTKTAD